MLVGGGGIIKRTSGNCIGRSLAFGFWWFGFDLKCLCWKLELTGDVNW